MDFKELSKPLDIKTDIDFRVQSVNKGWYATILAYKDARVDMNRLDKVVWPALWKREHFDWNTRCRVSIYNSEIKEWVSKEDIGTASKTEWEKWLASDSFKRACFNWGIGRELYDFPVIQLKLQDTEWDSKTGRTTWAFQLKDWKWAGKRDEQWKLIQLAAKDQDWTIRFNWKPE